MAIFRGRKKTAGNDLDSFFDDYEVPSFPGAINEVLGKIRHEETSNADIAADLEADPGMSVRILRLVNSAGFGLRHRVEDVCQAVQLVGRSSLESILISLAMKEIVPMKSRPGFDSVAFWRAAGQRAGIAGRLAARLNPPDRSFCWTAALLQDVAIPLLVDHMGDRYCAILETWIEGEEGLADLEREEIGFDHTELGRKICERWELPGRLSEAIAEHHALPTIETAPIRLVSMIKPSDRAADVEPVGVSEMIAAAPSIGLDAEDCATQVDEGLEDAKALNGLP